MPARHSMSGRYGNTPPHYTMKDRKITIGNKQNPKAVKAKLKASGWELKGFSVCGSRISSGYTRMLPNQPLEVLRVVS